MRFLPIFSKRYFILACFIIFSNLAGAFKIAVDIGGPTIKLDDKTENLTEGAIESLKILSKQFEVYFLSYCKLPMENKIRDLFKKNRIQDIIPEDRWIFVRDRADKATQMVERKIKVLIDDDRSGQIQGPMIGKFFIDGQEQVALEFLQFDLTSPHPWQDVFLELKKRGYISEVPIFKDGIPQE
jgi:hypothetical protein